MFRALPRICVPFISALWPRPQRLPRPVYYVWSCMGTELLGGSAQLDAFTRDAEHCARGQWAAASSCVLEKC